MEGYAVRCSDLPSIFMQQGMTINYVKHVTKAFDLWSSIHLLIVTPFQAGAAETAESERRLRAPVFKQDVFTQWTESGVS